MENEKRTLLAFVLIAAFLYVWFEFFVPKPAPVKPKPSENVEATSQTSEGETARTPDMAATPVGSTMKKKAETVKAPKVVVPPKKAPFSTDLVVGEWTNRGATLDSLTLKNYQKKQDGEENVQVIPFKPGVELPYLWRYRIGERTYRDDETAFEISTQEANRIVFQHDFGGELRVEKEFQWKQDSYEMEHEVRLMNLTGRPLDVQAEVSMSSANANEASGGLFSGPGITPLGAVAYINESSIRLTPAEILEGEDTFPEGPIEWAALDSHYFLVAAIPVEGLWRRVNGEAKASSDNAEEADAVTMWMAYPAKNIGPSSSSTLKLKLFGGPKDISVLHDTRDSLDRVIDLGDWLGPIARAILHFLRFLQGLLGNYGLAIIALTVTVRLLMFPLAQMQAKSMKKMQQHKPQMDALKEKFKDDKEAYSRELMTYMRTHKINPMGGCLLLLPQMPIFFALYRVLYNSIELRHSPFAFWIHDLSAKDPYFIMPILLGVAMFFQTRLTPSPGADPMQQNMMKMMPVMFTVFMLFLPAGLNLYILISTLWGIGQQLWVQRDMKVVAVPQAKAGRK